MQNRLDGLRMANIPNNKKHSRMDKALRDAIEVGDPLTDHRNSAAIGYRPLLEMTFTTGGMQRFYFGLVFRYFDIHDPSHPVVYEDEGSAGLLRMLSLREYLILWSDSTIDVRTRVDVDELLKKRYEQCGACKVPATASMLLCESCFVLWHPKCVHPDTEIGDDDTPMVCVECDNHIS